MFEILKRNSAKFPFPFSLDTSNNSNNEFMKKCFLQKLIDMYSYTIVPNYRSISQLSLIWWEKMCECSNISWKHYYHEIDVSSQVAAKKSQIFVEFHLPEHHIRMTTQEKKCISEHFIYRHIYIYIYCFLQIISVTNDKRPT